jgi:hypothetical protein
MDRIKLTPNRLKSAVGIDKDSFINISLDRTTKPINEYLLVNILNQQDQFEKERSSTHSYRFSGKINIYTANELFLYEDDPEPPNNRPNDLDWDPLFDGNPQLTPNNWLIQLLYPHKKVGDFNLTYYYYVGQTLNQIQSKANKGPQIKSMGLNNPVANEERVSVIGVQKHNLNIDDFVYVYNNNTSLNPYSGIHRIMSLGVDGEDLDKSFVIDTPYINDYTQPSNYIKILNPSQADLNFDNSIQISSITASDALGGISGVFTANEVIHTLIESLTPHNLGVVSGITSNRFIDVRGNAILNGIYEVINILDDYKFTIRLTYFNNKGQNQIFNFNRPRFRSLDGTPSEYYIRKYKVLTTNEYDVYNCSFSTSIYPNTGINELGISNNTWLFHFNKDINVEGLVDHNNKPLTELYVGFIKRAGQNTFPWSNVVSGWDFNRELINLTNGLETVSSFVSGGVGTIEKPNNLFDYFGDYVEYNKEDITEKIISKIVHRFAPATTPNGEGFYLEPFKKIQIRVFSTVIETSSIDEPTEGIPNYAETYPNGNIAWRDLLDIGYFEPEGNNGVDYPFVNGNHYMYDNYNLYIRRQFIPFDFDKKIDQSNVKSGKIQDVC